MSSYGKVFLVVGLIKACDFLICEAGNHGVVLEKGHLEVCVTFAAKMIGLIIENAALECKSALPHDQHDAQ
jgi:hypothetical protein